MRGRAQELVQLGRLGEAREVAKAFLDAGGSDPGVLLVLGEAHAAEDDDDHDDRAERAYQRGLEAFPDDLDLLTAYARLCLTSDVVDRPRRVDKGPELAARVRELAPGSAQARSLAAAPGGAARERLPKGPSSYRVQTHDLKWALGRATDRAAVIAASRAAAAAHPNDVRRQVQAHTLTAFERPAAARLLPIVLRPGVHHLVRALCLTALLVGRVWTGNSVLSVGLCLLGALVVDLPRLAVHRVLRRARRAAGPWPRGDFAPGLATGAVSESGLPPVPAYTLRERGAVRGPLALVLLVAVATVAWSWHLALAYPRYEVSAPTTLSGVGLTTEGPLAEFARALPSVGMPGESFAFAYGGMNQGDEGIVVTGSAGDFHGLADADFVDLPRLLLAGSADVRVGEVWRPDPGVLGGWMQCFTAEAKDGAWQQCSWADRGSAGHVAFRGFPPDQDRLSNLARTAREAVLHPREG
ncbi:hypothetical protein ACFWAR_30795 [Streptomyces sp. NPDC059917]|uniref:hypothetical protein n=1 Tax=Streptomyces sp. NPDC059917 TaxID=3347002 RepID=UPI003666C267